MPTRMVTYYRERTVYVSVLVEGPKRKRSSSSNNKYHQHLHVRHVANVGGYNRKAQLLDYSRNLRASAQSQPSTPLAPQPIQRQNSQIVAVKNKPRYVSLPTCMGRWKFVMPRFLRTFMPQNKKSKKKNNMASKTNKMKAIVKSFQIQRKPGLFSKMFASLRKGRR
ncbi:uncharacterized protein LOC107767642 [Nicotiana tabacum]|uniref:Uncharacterized protein LOC107767642 n=2 Tax=Nicotiana TaxID=4085 RepID=A0A1S3XQP0_TOBAC|nr:PREDICTED: uncharacterized protein LOC104224643 [Nicotiana sylvestris]XP_016442199.1 PREDICTED: uncharacterized protein LOC107767642 [Nicotiana tabacum]